MADFGINEMLGMQKTLQEKYKAIWEGISPDAGKNKLRIRLPAYTNRQKVIIDTKNQHKG